MPANPITMSTSSYYPSDPYDVSDYDDPDDFAEEWAEEFGDGNYDDGYDDAIIGRVNGIERKDWTQ